METSWPEMEARGNHITEVDVSAFEERLQRALPADYRDFLLAVNGGRPARSKCVFAAGVINRLFSLGDEKESRNLEICAGRARVRLPSPDLLEVGYNGTGGSILIALHPDRAGEVWFHEPSDRPADANPRVLWHDRRDMKKLAPNWRDFMTNLGPIS